MCEYTHTHAGAPPWYRMTQASGLATMLTDWAQDEELNPGELVGTLVANARRADRMKPKSRTRSTASVTRCGRIRRGNGRWPHEVL